MSRAIFVEATMRVRTGSLCAATAAVLLPFTAAAAALKIVNVNAPAVSCVFQTSCTTRHDTRA